jgi:hypothetical protein
LIRHTSVSQLRHDLGQVDSDNGGTIAEGSFNYIGTGLLVQQSQHC